MTCTCGHHADDHVTGLSDHDRSPSTFRPCFKCNCMSLSQEAREASAAS